MTDDSAGKTPAELESLLIANGFQFPATILTARTISKLGLPVACAMLTKESSGGYNIYGHDVYPGGIEAPGYGWGAVTETNVAAFLKLRDATGRTNGVGPPQLTSVSLQNEATAAGGLWVPQHTMAVGFHFLHDLIAEHGTVEAGCAAYNGSGPAAAAYGQDCLVLAEHYKTIGLGTVIGNLD